MDNAAFEEDRGIPELLRIIAELTGQLAKGFTCGHAKDINGNSVGGFEIWDRPEEE